MILCGGWLGGVPGLCGKTQVLVVCNVLVALEIVKTLNLIDSTWLYQGKRTKLCCHIAYGFVEKPLFFEKVSLQLFWLLQGGGVLSPKVHTPWDGFGSTPVHLARSESW